MLKGCSRTLLPVLDFCNIFNIALPGLDTHLRNFRSWHSSFGLHPAVVHNVLLYRKSRIHARRAHVRDEPKSSRSSRHGILHHNSVRHRTELLEIALERLVRRFERESTDENFAGGLRAAVWCGITEQQREKTRGSHLSSYLQISAGVCQQDTPLTSRDTPDEPKTRSISAADTSPPTTSSPRGLDGELNGDFHETGGDLRTLTQGMQPALPYSTYSTLETSASEIRQTTTILRVQIDFRSYRCVTQAEGGLPAVSFQNENNQHLRAPQAHAQPQDTLRHSHASSIRVSHRIRRQFVPQARQAYRRGKLQIGCCALSRSSRVVRTELDLCPPGTPALSQKRPPKITKRLGTIGPFSLWCRVVQLACSPGSG